MRPAAVIILGFGLGAVLWIWSRDLEAAQREPQLDPEWTPPFGEWGGWGWNEPETEAPAEEGGGLSLAEELLYGIMPVNFDMENANLQAFLAMIRYAEGTSGANGYRMLFGGGLFDSFADHPRQRITARLGGQTITSSAAGAYQILERTWDDIRRLAGLPDFSPASQDKAAVFLIRRRGALADVRAGRFDAAVEKCNREWASLAGSPYGQPTKSLADLRRIYVASGGQVTGGSVFA